MLYILLNVIIFKIFTDAYIQDFYNKNMAYLKKIINKSYDYDKWYLAIKKEMSLIKVYVFNLSFISIIFNTIVFFCHDIYSWKNYEITRQFIRRIQ